MIYHGIDIPEDKIADFRRRNHIRKLALFGSVLRDDFTPESDIDVLVEFEPGQPVGYFGMSRMQRELSEMVGRTVDLRTHGCLSRYFRDEVIREAEALYVAA